MRGRFDKKIVLLVAGGVRRADVPDGDLRA
jgi:hypothetical protein